MTETIDQSALLKSLGQTPMYRTMSCYHKFAYSGETNEYKIFVLLKSNPDDPTEILHKMLLKDIVYNSMIEITDKQKQELVLHWDTQKTW